MARIIGKVLPERLKTYLEENRRADEGSAILLATIDGEGLPHFAMLSAWEVLPEDGRLRIATYKSSTTTRNMKERGSVALAFIDREMSYYVKGVAEFIRFEETINPPVAVFRVNISAVLEEEVSSEISQGIKYRKDSQIEPHKEVFELLSRR
ncbi:MAG: pyridoxamine 5'-phosphate oxidase family protein [Aigarchaeota archaeon]|nr:pyridoxamine 5'-phosphate oxidase family protein [Aigarchaeota archaeon]MDW8092780.1 pyridoxamine 5'-phosphate oxidase family protein [Nitrososphaerota archaeon]